MKLLFTCISLIAVIFLSMGKAQGKIFTLRADSQTVVIRHIDSGLVFDGTEHEVKLQNYTKNPHQQWNVISVAPFTYIIQNVGSKLDLSVGGMFRNGANVITEPHKWARQEWVISSKYIIINLLDTWMIVDVPANVKSYQGVPLIVTIANNGPPKQKFTFENQ